MCDTLGISSVHVHNLTCLVLYHLWISDITFILRYKVQTILYRTGSIKLFSIFQFYVVDEFVLNINVLLICCVCPLN